MKTFAPFFFVLTFSFCDLSYAQSTGPSSPLSTENQPLATCSNCTGAIWSNTDKVNAVDNVYAETQLGANGICFQSWCSRSRYLTCYDFGFNVPSNAQISGIVLSINSKCDIPGTVLDCTIVMKKAYAPTGTNFASASDWDTTGQFRIYGSPSELWGLTWTPQEINDVNFGTYIKVYNTSSLSPKIYVDAVQITVYYNLGNAVFSQTSSPGGFKARFDADNDQFQIHVLSENQIKQGILQILDLNGKICYTKNINVNSGEEIIEKINAASLTEGIYFCTLSTPEHFYSSKVPLIK